MRRVTNHGVTNEYCGTEMQARGQAARNKQDECRALVLIPAIEANAPG